MDTRESAMLERIAADVQAIRERLPVLEERVSAADRRIGDFEARMRALEGAVGRLVVIAAIGGGIVSAGVGLVVRALGK
jgi:hypothetical protein